MPKRLILSFLSILVCTSLAAQFVVGGSDPASVKWMQAESPSFRIIYPAGEDSLARVYAYWLERTKVPVCWSSGMTAGESYRRKMPVILHSHSAISNASVTWAPKRMDIYTCPDAYSPTPIGWERLLAIHEGRHVSQMQFGARGRNKVMHVLVGEMFAGALAGLYPGPTLLEGDAVTAETALTSSGRGRQASFLSYMAPAFDSGDFRDYWKWSFGSKKYYAPDYYRAGYMLVSGMRVFHDDPLFVKDYFDKASGKSLFFLLQRTVKEGSGMPLRKTFRSIEEGYRNLWNEEASGRGPFMPSRQVSAKPWRHESYSGAVFAEGSGIWSKRSGLTRPGSLVRLGEDGSVLFSRPFSLSSSELFYDSAGERIWWSENVADWRWPRAGSSRVRYLETSNPSKVHELNKEGRFFNPSPSPDGRMVCVTEYPSAGGSRLLLLEVPEGRVARVLCATDSLQFTESAWIGGRLFAAGLSPSGMGIYSVEEKSLKLVLGPSPVELSHLRTFASGENVFLSFLSDRSGVNELHLLDVDSGALLQATSTRYGISSPFLGSGTDTLYYSSLAPSDRPEACLQGNMVYATAVSDLPMVPVSFSDVHRYPVADAMSRQERELAGDDWDKFETFPETILSRPKRFHRIVPTLHSWAPFYFNYDNIESFSGDDWYRTASPGATLMFQNITGDGYGFAGYSVHSDTGDSQGWRHSGHFKYLYTGLVPAVELSADIGDRESHTIQRVQQVDLDREETALFTQREKSGKPYFEGTMKVYVPINLNSGGLSRGIVPQVRFKFTNDRFDDRVSLREVHEDQGKRSIRETGLLGKDHISRLTTLDVSVRGYILRSKAPSQVYPRLGIGAEAGFHSRPSHSESFSNTAYLYTYAYLPGILQDQGLRITATAGADIGGGTYSYPDTPVSFIPRGFAETNLKTIGNSCSPAKFRVTLDYAIPFLNLDWSGLCPFFYVMNLQLTPFFDYSYQRFNYFEEYHINRNNVHSDNMTSFGADLSVNLGNFAWLPYETKVGVRYARNSWKEIEKFPVSGLKHDFFGWIFSISM